MNDPLSLVITSSRLALRAVRRNALRSFLTAFGILVGVAAVSIVVALGQGAKDVVAGKIDTLGSNAMVVMPERRRASGARGETDAPSLTDGDVRAIAREATAIRHAAPWIQTAGHVAYRSENTSVPIGGTNRAFFGVRDWELSQGDYWTEAAETTGARVCIIGEVVRDKLFGSASPVGHVLRIGQHPFVVVGVLAEKGQSPFGDDQDDILLMPTETLRAKVTSDRSDRVHRILLSAASANATDKAVRQVSAILRQRHRLAEGAESDFRIRTQEEFRQVQMRILGILRLLLLGIAAVSLVVGGIGVMNIMLVSVAERTREIGIRLAIGARQIDILAQFLVEAVVVSLLGGLGGALAALVGIEVVGNVTDLPMRLSPTALGVALFVSMSIGVVFGFFPARRAARLDPIVALRHR